MWSEKILDIDMFLEIIQQYSYVYDKNRIGFKDTVKKENAWKEMARALNFEVAGLKTRWRTLRERFSRELKKGQPLSGDGGSSPAMVHTKWEYFDQLLFLEKFILPRRRISSMHSSESGSIDYGTQEEYEDGVEINSDYNEIENEIISFLPTPPPKRTCLRAKTFDRNHLESNDVETIDSKKFQTVNKIENSVDDEDEIFCKVLACELRKITDSKEKQKRKAEMYLIATGLKGV